MLVSRSVLRTSSPAHRGLSAQAMKAVKVGTSGERCRTALSFKQAPEATVLSLDDTNADVIRPSAVHCGQWKAELGGGGDPEELPQPPVPAQRDLHHCTQTVPVTLVHQFTQADGFLPVARPLAVRSHRRMKRVGQGRLLRVVVPQAVWRRHGPRGTNHGTRLIDQLPVKCLRRK